MNFSAGYCRAWRRVAVGLAGPKLYQIALRRARDDHSNRPALWNRFYSVDWGETTTNNYGFAPAEGDHPQRFQHQMYLRAAGRLREERGLRAGPQVARSQLRPRRRAQCLSLGGTASSTRPGSTSPSSAVAFCRAELWRERPAAVRRGQRARPAVPRRQLRRRAQRRGVERLWRPPAFLPRGGASPEAGRGVPLRRHDEAGPARADGAGTGVRRIRRPSSATSPAMSPRPAASTARAAAR